MAYKMLPANARPARQTTAVGDMEETPEVTPEDSAEDQGKPELLAVKEFVNGLDDVQFGYLQECIQKRLEAGMDEVDAADRKPPELVFNEMEEENEAAPRIKND